MSSEIRSSPTPWQAIVLLCGKCARKLDGGYGEKGRDSLRSALRGALKESGRRREVRIIETRCLGLCPKRAVTMINASHPERILVVPAGTPVEQALRLATEAAG